MRFTIREMLWLTAVVAMGVVVWMNQRTTKAERASLERVKRELDSRRQSMDQEWNYLQATFGTNDQRRLQRSFFQADQVTESERQRTMKRSAELGAPQPRPLPPGFAEHTANR